MGSNGCDQGVCWMVRGVVPQGELWGVVNE